MPSSMSTVTSRQTGAPHLGVGVALKATICIGDSLGRGAAPPASAGAEDGTRDGAPPGACGPPFGSRSAGTGLVRLRRRFSHRRAGVARAPAAGPCIRHPCPLP